MARKTVKLDNLIVSGSPKGVDIVVDIMAAANRTRKQDEPKGGKMTVRKKP